MKCKHKKGVKCYLMKCENCKIFKEAGQTTLKLVEEIKRLSKNE
jgi:hypothetical protein